MLPPSGALPDINHGKQNLVDQASGASAGDVIAGAADIAGTIANGVGCLEGCGSCLSAVLLALGLAAGSAYASGLVR